MAAKIFNRDIQVGLEQAWHNKTVIVPKIEKANCGIVYPMELQKLHLPNGNPTEHYTVVSLDDNMSIGDTVKKGYKIISNEQMIDMVESALGGTTHKIVSVGSLCNREKVFCSIKLSDDFVAGKRETKNVLNVLWGHGGVFGVTARAGFTVVVCANTFAMALRQKGSDFRLNLKHTGNTEVKIENMQKAIEAHYGVISEFKAAMDSFDSQAISKVDAKRLIAGFMVRDTDEVEKVSTRTANSIDRINTLFCNGAGNKGETVCDLFNGFTDYFSHESSGGEDRIKQFAASEFGTGFRAKTEAFDLLSGKDVPKLGDRNTVSKRGERVLQMI